MEKIIASILLACSTAIGSSAAPTLSVRKNTHVPDQNIALGSPMQTFGSYTAEVTNGSIATTDLLFAVITDVPGRIAKFRDVVLVDENGNIVAGPVDAEFVETIQGVETGAIYFTDTVVVPEGTHTLTLKGLVGQGFENGGLIGTLAFVEYWTLTDLESWVSVAPPAIVVEGQSMTARGPSLHGETEFPKTEVVAGEKQALVSKSTLDALSSSEDMRVTGFRTRYEGDPNLISWVRLYDGDTALTSGVNILHPTQSGEYVITPDVPLLIPKGTLKQIEVKTDIRSGSEGSFAFYLTGVAAVGAESGMAPSARGWTMPSEVPLITVLPMGSIWVHRTPFPMVQTGSIIKGLEWDMMTKGEPFLGHSVRVDIEVIPFSPSSGAGIANLDPQAALFVKETPISGVIRPTAGGERGTVTFDIGSIVLPQDASSAFRLELSTTGLTTGDRIVSHAWGLSFVGYVSGKSASFGDFPIGEVTLRRVPSGAVGDVNEDGWIDEKDRQKIAVAVQSGDAPADVDIWRRMNCRPDGKIDAGDLEVLQKYLAGELLTLPLGDVNFGWTHSTLDITEMRRHILGIAPFTLPQQIAAADVNGSGKVSTLDITVARRWILGKE